MSTVFAKVCLRDYIRRHVCPVPKDAADGLVIDPLLEPTLPVIPAEEELVWYFVFPSLSIHF
jgi:hypothetical protein